MPNSNRLETEENKPEESRSTELLLSAVIANNEEAVKQLLQNGADPNRMGESGSYPLDAAASQGYLNIVNLLLDKKALPNQQNGYGFTALHWAAANDHVAVLETLLKRGAIPDPEVWWMRKQDKIGTPLRYAKPGSEVHKKLIAWFKKNNMEIPMAISSQDLVIKPLMAMGYGNNELTPKGLCFGIHSTAMQAMLTGNMKSFIERYELLEEYRDKAEELKKDINDVREKIKIRKEEILTPREKILLELPAFFEHVILLQQGIPSDLLEDQDKEYKNQQNLHLGLPRVVSHQLEEEGVYQAGSPISGIYNATELHEFFTEFRKALNNEGIKNPVMLSMHGGSHAITIGYHPEKNEWTFTDANLKRPISFVSTSEQDDRRLVGLVQIALRADTIAMFANVLSTGKEKDNVAIAIEKWKKTDPMKNMHTPTPEKAQKKDSHGNDWQIYARFAGDSVCVENLHAMNAPAQAQQRKTAIKVGAALGVLPGIILAAGMVVGSILTGGIFPLLAAGIMITLGAMTGSSFLYGGIYIAQKLRMKQDIDFANNNKKFNAVSEIIAPRLAKNQHNNDSTESVAEKLHVTPQAFFEHKSDQQTSHQEHANQTDNKRSYAVVNHPTYPSHEEKENESKPEFSTALTKKH